MKKGNDGTSYLNLKSSHFKPPSPQRGVFLFSPKIFSYLLCPPNLKKNFQKNFIKIRIILYLCIVKLKQYIMKISYYNWSWWFILTLLTIFIGMFIGMVTNNDSERFIANIIIVVGLVSLIPCLYIGMKSE